MPFPISALRRATDRLHVGRAQAVASAAAVLVVAGATVAALGGTGVSRSSRSDRVLPATAKSVAGSTGGAVSTGIDSRPGFATAAGAPLDAVGSNEAAPAGADAALASPPVAGGLAPAPGTEKIIRTASLQVEVKKRGVDRGYDAVARIAADHGGYVASSTRSSGSSSSAQLEVRVPADRFDETRQALRAVGTIRNEELRGQDVTSQLVDMDARLKSLQAEEQTLRSLVGQAKTVGEVLQVQPQLFDVRRQIEQLQASRQQLDQQATLATISVAIAEPGAASPSPSPHPQPVLSRSATRAWNASLNVVGGMLVVLGSTLPIALLAALVWLIARGRRRTGPEAIPAPAVTT